MKEVQPEIATEISLPAIVNSTSDVAHLNEPSLYKGLVEHALGSIDTGTNLKLKTEEFKLDFTSNVPHLNEIKKEISLSEPYLNDGFLEHAVVKCEDISIQSLDLQLKSEVPDLQCDIKSGIDDIYIKLEPLVNEELHIKNEFEDLVGQKSIKVRHFYCGLCNSKLTSKRSLQRHLNIHTGDKPFECNLCDYKCIEKGNLQPHMKTHTQEKPFKCSVCNYSCIRKCDIQ